MTFGDIGYISLFDNLNVELKCDPFREADEIFLVIGADGVSFFKDCKVSAQVLNVRLWRHLGKRVFVKAEFFSVHLFLWFLEIADSGDTFAKID